MKQETFMNRVLAILVFLVIVLFFGFLFYMVEKTPKQYIDLPEEISLAKPGDTLYVIKNNPDTLELGFRK